MAHTASQDASHASHAGHGHAGHGGHGHGHGHGHFVVPARTLLVVFGLLLFFTFTTVLAANVEQFIAHAFRIEIPQWVNVAVALSIAAVKSIIVALYFMQLRYDNPMNGAIAVFTFFVLMCFLGFTMIDLGARDALYSYKARQIVEGGTGGVKRAPDGEVIQGSIALFSRTQAFAAIAELRKSGKPKDQWPKHLRKYAAHMEHDEHGHGHGHAASTSSSANQSRVKTGVTLTELGGGSAGHGHADDHAKPAGEAKPDPAKPAEKH